MPRSTSRHEPRVELRAPRRDHRHLEVRAGSEQRPVRERAAGRVGEDGARLGHAQRGRGEVVGRVVEHRAAADPLELGPHPRHLVDEPRPGLDVGVELAGDDAREVEAGRAELEGAAAHRRGVDEVAQHLHRRPGRPAAQPVGPEQPGEVGVPRGPDPPVGDDPAPAHGDEALAGLDLHHAGRADLAHGRSAVRRRAAQRSERDRHAGGLEAGHGGARAVDRVHDEDPVAARWRHEPAVLGEVGAAGRLRGDEGRQLLLGGGVDREGHVALAGAAPRVGAAGVGAELRPDAIAQAAREAGDEVDVGAGGHGGGRRLARVTRGSPA